MKTEKEKFNEIRSYIEQGVAQEKERILKDIKKLEVDIWNLAFMEKIIKIVEGEKET